MKGSLGKVLATGIIVAILLGGLVSEARADNAAHKVGRGLKNVGIAPAEIPVAIVNWSADKNPFVGLVVGPVAGLVNCVTRITAGVVEIITFPVPPYDRPLYERELGETFWK